MMISISPKEKGETKRVSDQLLGLWCKNRQIAQANAGWC